MTSLRILFAWPGLSGYNGACWRELQRCPDVKVKCIVATDSVPDGSRSYDIEKAYGGIDVHFVEKTAPIEKEALRKEILDFAPDVAFITGWSVPVNRFIATDSAFRGIKKVLQMDMPWKWQPRKIAARFVLRNYLRSFSAAFVPGEASARYARWLGFSGERPVYTGLLATDLARFTEPTRPWKSRSFLYVGRYSPEKGVDVLVEAYRIYCRMVENPWPLDFAGGGVLGKTLFPADEGAVGKGIVRNLGFKQPDELAEVYARHGVLILPSRSESWGVVLAEAAGCGLPLICTNACGGRFELVHETGAEPNGFIAQAGNAQSLAQVMARMHALDDAQLRTLSENSRVKSLPYSASVWAGRVMRMAKEVRGKK